MEILQNGNSNITISNISGQTIYNKNIRDTNKDIDVSSFTAGFYFIKVTEGYSVTTKKLIIN
ncbi:T9SS type A sorting domain-containing protein [Polaribacter staleyi]|uniref:T9SS type A sorting domain-containing protein n=1 Tax=Polaribacter staleyi TaxID=2022337 RepID=UPI0031BBBF62